VIDTFCIPNTGIIGLACSLTTPQNGVVGITDRTQPIVPFTLPYVTQTTEVLATQGSPNFFVVIFLHTNDNTVTFYNYASNTLIQQFASVTQGTQLYAPLVGPFRVVIPASGGSMNQIYVGTTSSLVYFLLSGSGASTTVQYMSSITLPNSPISYV
jgi:hypothetical protein